MLKTQATLEAQERQLPKELNSPTGSPHSPYHRILERRDETEAEVRPGPGLEPCGTSSNRGRVGRSQTRPRQRAVSTTNATRRRLKAVPPNATQHGSHDPHDEDARPKGAATEMKLYQKSLEQFYSTAGMKAIGKSQQGKGGIEATHSGFGDASKETRFLRQQLSRDHWMSELELKGDTSHLLRALHHIQTPAHNFHLAENACLLSSSKRLGTRTSPRRAKHTEL